MIPYRNRGEAEARTGLQWYSFKRMTPRSAITNSSSQGPTTTIRTINQVSFYNNCGVYVHKDYLEATITRHSSLATTSQPLRDQSAVHAAA